MLGQGVWAPRTFLIAAGLAWGAAEGILRIPAAKKRATRGATIAALTTAAVLVYAVLQDLGWCEPWRPELWADVFQRPL
jgi:hypothetical protein